MAKAPIAADQRACRCFLEDLGPGVADDFSALQNITLSGQMPHTVRVDSAKICGDKMLGYPFSVSFIRPGCHQYPL